MSRKRDKPYNSRHVPYSFPKRRRPLPPHSPDAADDYRPENNNNPSAKSPSTVVVLGLPVDCSLLDIKSRFEIYGQISRTTMLDGGVARLTFRSKDSADSAIAASQDPSFGITIDSRRVQVMWESDTVPHWREGVMRNHNPSSSSSSSKLVRPELPLSRHGRGNKLGSAIVNPRNSSNGPVSDLPFMGREIVAYDDIL